MLPLPELPEEEEEEEEEDDARGSTPMAAHMRANWARNDGFDRISFACVCAKLCSRDRNTASCVSRACAFVLRSELPCEANWADVRRERSKAARPTPLRDIFWLFFSGDDVAVMLLSSP